MPLWKVDDESCVTYGSMVQLNDKEIELLDGFEGRPFVYDRQPVSILVATEPETDILEDGELEQMDVIAYIRVNQEFEVPPTPQYLTACKMTLAEQFKKCPEAKKLKINCVQNGVLSTLEEDYKLPSILEMDISAFFVMVNNQRQNAWQMPAQIGINISSLKQINITTTKQIQEYMASNGNIQSFDQESNDIFKSLFQ